MKSCSPRLEWVRETIMKAHMDRSHMDRTWVSIICTECRFKNRSSFTPPSLPDVFSTIVLSASLRKHFELNSNSEVYSKLSNIKEVG